MKELSNTFDPNGPGIQGNIFGLPYTIDEAEIVLVPVPWEATVSYHTGTANAPEAILRASIQIDLLHHYIKDAWFTRIAMTPVSEDLLKESDAIRTLAADYISSGHRPDLETSRIITQKLNEGCENLNIYIKNVCASFLNQGKLVGIVGGDHSVPLGLLRALALKHDRFGILQIDAHADLRKAYQGFTYSHASIMLNALKLPAVSRLVQVGIRDYCQEEKEVMHRSMGRVKTFFNAEMATHREEGKTWSSICTEIVEHLPPLVYISMDIDGLDPSLCPNTGTPVPGGLTYDQLTYLLKEIMKSGKRIIGFDLCEVAPGAHDWDANVGARVLWELCQWMQASHHPELFSR